MEDRRSKIPVVEILIRRRFLIAKIVLSVTIISILYSLLLVSKYTARATIMPPNSGQESLMGMMSNNLPAGFTNLGRLMGVVPGTGGSSDLFAAILQSDRIKKIIITRFDLMKSFRVKSVTDAIKALDKITAVDITEEGIISIKVTYKNKHLAADIANAYVEELDKFNKETAMTLGKKYRIFIEQRLATVNVDLVNAEESLRTFQENNRTVSLDNELKSAIEAIAKLKGEIITKEAQKNAMESFSSPDNPYVQDINNELIGMKRELARIEFGGKDGQNREFGAGFAMPLTKLPEITLNYTRLLRDLKVQEVVYELLTQQYEQAKITEVKDTPTIQFLDFATPPEKASYPHRKVIVVFSFFVSILAACVFVLILDYFERIRKTPGWQRIYKTVIQDLGALKIKLSTLSRRRSR